MRLYICKGKGRTYEIEANSPASARGFAGRKYLEEIGGLYPQSFYALYFKARIAEPKAPGRVSTRILPDAEEVQA